MNELVYCDVIEELKKEIADIKIRISALIQEKEELEYHICPELKAEYYEKIGKIEVNIRMLELTADELKYRISILQAAINRREKVSEKKVEEKVEEKYSEYRKRYEEAYDQAQEEQKAQEDQQRRKQENYEKYENKTKNAEGKDEDSFDKDKSDDNANQKDETNDRDGDKETYDESYRKMSYSQKIKELYRRIVKKLHPDINPNITEHEKELFYETQKAYREGDLEKLEEIYEEISSGDVVAGSGNSAEDIERLKDTRDKLLNKLEILKKEIQVIKSSFPYSAKDMLNDPDALAQKQEELNQIIKVYQEIVDELTEIYNKLKDELYNPKGKGTENAEKDSTNSDDVGNENANQGDTAGQTDAASKQDEAEEPEEFWE